MDAADAAVSRGFALLLIGIHQGYLRSLGKAFNDRPAFREIFDLHVAGVPSLPAPNIDNWFPFLLVQRLAWNRERILDILSRDRYASGDPEVRRIAIVSISKTAGKLRVESDSK